MRVEALLSGTTVLIKGTTMGAITDNNGKYSIDASSRDVSLVFSFIGYVTQEVPVQNRAVVDVVLKAEVLGLEEVIVVGYGTQKKSDITGTVSSLPKDRLEMAPNLNLTQAIMGAVPGVMIQTNCCRCQSGPVNNDTWKEFNFSRQLTTYHR